VTKALKCMSPGIDQSPAEWRRRLPDSNAGRVPPISIWQRDSDARVAPRNQKELVEQWAAFHGIPATPARTERIGRIARELYQDTANVTRVESVVVEGLGHAFPIIGEASTCGQPGDFVVAAGVCAA